nr:MAG TPA: Putative heavy-metal-binding protein [Caudoviricetes sp.]
MKFTIGFRNLQEAQQKQFTELYKSIPCDLVSAFKELASKLNCNVLIDVDGSFTFLTVVGK